MKFAVFLSCILLLTACQENDDLVIEIKTVSFSPTKLQSTDGLPFTIEDSINGAHLGFRINWEVESNNEPYDPVETTVRIKNRVADFKIWSNQTISGRSPGSSLNTLFNIYYKENIDERQLAANQGLGYLADVTEVSGPVISSLLKAKTTITPGGYDFYFRSELLDGTVLLDSAINVKIR
jgi:hypothetical protein